MAQLKIDKQGLAAALILAVSVIALPAEAAFGTLKDEYWKSHASEAAVSVDHAPWAELLEIYLHEGLSGVHLFDYAGVSQADKAKLDTYVAYLQSLPATGLTRDQQFAYWVNLYNAVTVKLVIEAYPVDSIRDVRPSGLFSPGPWKRKLITVEGRRLSLDNIEHNILRPIWRDPRIHYAVNCASIGCP
ncbi:MAG: DUF547 domain-containing protein, partial [Alphaproteobacteria bacterium]|nr:DUF547 domain-containing protein [Alphaproteobacteria bacterium]